MYQNKKLVDYISIVALTALVLLTTCSDAEVKYKIVVKTGTRNRPGVLDGPGTDAAIKIKLVGINKKNNRLGSTKVMKLSGSFFKNNFEFGQTDTFTVKDSKDLRNINQILVTRNNFGLFPDWLPEKIIVTNKNDEQSYEFYPNIWLTDPNRFYDISVTPPPDPTTVSPSPTPSPPRPAYLANYKIVTKTGTQRRPFKIDGPGTDANVEIILFGISKQKGIQADTASMKLTGSLLINNFESGQTDELVVKSSEDLKNIDKIQVKRDNSGFGPDWLLEKVTVTNMNDGQSYEFNANIWLTEKDKYYEIESTPATPSPPPLPTEAVKYQIEVKTGTQRRRGKIDGPGTDANIELILIGIERKNGQPAQTSSVKLSGSLFKNNFESGGRDKFTVQDLKDLTDINELQVKRDNFGLFPDWLLDKVTVTNEKDRRRYKFNANIWLTEPNVYYDISASPPTPSPTPVISGITYNIIVYTGSSFESSSSANVYITLYGSQKASGEIHLKILAGLEMFSALSTKVFETSNPELGKIEKIRIRQDGSGRSPNLEIDKVIIIANKEMVYEFAVSAYLEAANALERTLPDEYPALSIKFKSYPQCVHTYESKVHPPPFSSVIIADGCAQLYTFFRFLPDGVILHLASGMCIQSESKGDPKDITSGTKILLGPQKMFSDGQKTFIKTFTPHALEFTLTPGGSLQEKKSGKCVASTGVPNTPLTFTDTCDTDNIKVGFIDKNGQILIPSGNESQASTTSSPSAPPTEATTPGIDWNCPSWCAPACQPSCTQACCSGQQQPVYYPQIYSHPQLILCPGYCTPAKCRSTCPNICCTQKSDTEYSERINEKY